MPSITLPNAAGVSTDQMQSIGEALSNSNRWAPYCEGLDGWDRASTAILLENQHRFMNTELNEVTKILSIGNFDKFS